MRFLLLLIILGLTVSLVFLFKKRKETESVNLKNTKKASQRLGIKAEEAEEEIYQKSLPTEVVETNNPKLNALINEGYSSIDSMTKLLKSISDTDIKDKINTIINLTQKIITHAIEDADDITQIKKFFNYYLPTTVKLLTAYQNMESQSIEGINITESKNKITEMLDICIEAYEKKLDSLFENQALDIETDIDVMNQFLNKEGLLNNIDFQLKEGNGNG